MQPYQRLRKSTTWMSWYYYKNKMSAEGGLTFFGTYGILIIADVV